MRGVPISPERLLGASVRTRTPLGTQLYFERRRVLAELSVAPPDGRLRLGLRAAELAAGIDAWTGGWFSRARAGRP